MVVGNVAVNQLHPQDVVAPAVAACCGWWWWQPTAGEWRCDRVNRAKKQGRSCLRAHLNRTDSTLPKGVNRALSAGAFVFTGRLPTNTVRCDGRRVGGEGER